MVKVDFKTAIFMHFGVAAEVLFIYLTRNQLQQSVGIQFKCVDTIWIEFPRRSDFNQSKVDMNIGHFIYRGIFRVIIFGSWTTLVTFRVEDFQSLRFFSITKLIGQNPKCITLIKSYDILGIFFERKRLWYFFESRNEIPIRFR